MQGCGYWKTNERTEEDLHGGGLVVKNFGNWRRPDLELHFFVVFSALDLDDDMTWLSDS